MSEEKVLNLYQRLSAVYADLKMIERDGKNSFQNYKYASESCLMEAIRPLVAKHGIVLFFDVVEEEKVQYTTNKSRNAFMAKMSIELTFVNADSPEERHKVRCIGEASDTDDKAYYKAYTGGVKYALFKNFLVSSGEDVEPNRSKDYEKGLSYQGTVPNGQTRQPATNYEDVKKASPTWAYCIDAIDADKIQAVLDYIDKNKKSVMDRFGDVYVFNKNLSKLGKYRITSAEVEEARILHDGKQVAEDDMPDFDMPGLASAEGGA